MGLLLAWWAVKVLYPALLLAIRASERIPGFAGNRYGTGLSRLRLYAVDGAARGVAAGLAPALQASRPGLTSALKGEGSIFGEHLSQSRLRNALIIAQLAFSLVLLLSAGLLVRNLQKMQNVDTGYETTRLFALKPIRPPAGRANRRPCASSLKRGCARCLMCDRSAALRAPH